MPQLLMDQLRTLVTKTLSPGERFPTFDELERQFDTSRAKAQRAVANLKRDGFIYTAGRRGTFVADRPPHLSRYGMVLLNDASSHNRFLQSLVREAPLVGKAMNGDVAIYESADLSDDSETYQQLLLDCKERRLAGLIFAGELSGLVRPVLLQYSDVVPMVAITYEVNAAIARVTLDNANFVHRSLDWLASRGRRRVATVSLPRHPNATLWPEAICARGWESPDRWRQSVGKDYTPAARGITELLFSMPEAIRPDALVITDDNLVEHALAGLVASGLSVGTDVDVVTHCNWPYPVPSILPVCRLGYDIWEVLKSCISNIESIRSGDSVAPMQRIAPLFEQEVPAHH